MSVKPSDEPHLDDDVAESQDPEVASSSETAGPSCISQRRRVLIIGSLLLVAVVAVVVAVPLALRGGGESSSSLTSPNKEIISTTAGPTPAATEMLRGEPTPAPQQKQQQALEGGESVFTSFTTPTPTSAPSTMPRSSIVLAILPDSQYALEGSPYIFDAQIQWLVDHHEALGRPFIIHVGDVVQSPSVKAQWESAQSAMVDGFVQGGIAHSVSSGNHDVRRQHLDDDERVVSSEEEPYLQYFGPESSRSVAGRDPTGWSEYHLTNIQGMQLLVLAPDWRVSDGTLEWMRSVLKDHSNMPAVLVSHECLTPDPNSDSPTGGVKRTECGEYLWQNLVAAENQIFLVICGHIDGSGYRIDSNSYGQPIPQILVNYQEHSAGGNGLTRLMEIDFARNSIRQFTFSPWVVRLWREEGVGALAPHDVVVRKDDDSDFVVDVNVTERFDSIGAEVPAELTRQAGVPWLDVIRSELEEVPLPSTSQAPPDHADDYPVLEDTVAHWRFEDIANQIEEGKPVPVDVLVTDLSGNGNHLTRLDTLGGLPEHLVVGGDSHPLSASEAGLCFVNPDRTEGGYLTTIDSAPMNNATFADSGYTIEAFVKLPPTFLDDSRPYRWTGIVAREGLIHDAFPEAEAEGDTNEPLAVLGVSNLAEVQFASWPVEQDSETRRVVTAWSSPLELDKWYHVAAVNDGNQTRLYIDGWPARRDPVYDTGVAGLASASGKGWMVGASFWGNNPKKVFGGCIGEVRISARALAVDELLLSRRWEE